MKTYFGYRFATKEKGPVNSICLSASDFAYTIITSIRLLTLRLSGWNLEQVTAELDLSSIMDKQIDDLTEVLSMRSSRILAAEQDRSAGDPFGRLQGLLRGLREIVRVEIESRKLKLTGEEDGLMTTMMMTPSDEALELTAGLDDDFWRDMMNETVLSGGMEPAMVGFGDVT